MWGNWNIDIDKFISIEILSNWIAVFAMAILLFFLISSQSSWFFFCGSGSVKLEIDIFNITGNFGI